MKFFTLFGVALALSALPSDTSHAAPVNYNESVGGDLSNTPFFFTVFTLQPGANTISGTTGGDASGAGGPDFDGFGFIVPTGYQLTGAAVTVADAIGDVSTVKWSVSKGSTDPFQASFIGSIESTSPGSAQLAGVPLGPDSYALYANEITWPPPSSGDRRASYTFTLTVVPEPAGLSALACGALALLARRRRT